MSTSTGKVIAKAREFLADVPEGIRYAQLHRQIATAFPNIPPNTIHGALHKFRTVSRLDALARIFGIGLILFDTSNPMEPEFSIRVRASRHEPDVFYVNKYLKLIETDLFG